MFSTQSIALILALSLYGATQGQADDESDPAAARGHPSVSELPGPSEGASEGATTKAGPRRAIPSAALRKAQSHPKPAVKPEPKPNGTVKAAATPETSAPVARAQPVAPQSVGEPTGEFEPVLHARSAQITTCMDKIVALSGRVIDRPHQAVSSWVQAAPNDHVFQSIVGLTYPNKGAPNGAAIVLAAPLGTAKCEGETVQIYPTTSSCTAVQATLVKNGRTLTTLQSLPLLETKDGNRNLLMPTAGGGCVIVSIGLH